MPTILHRQVVVVGSACFAVGWLFGQGDPSIVRAQVHASAPAFPMTARMGANIYLQRSAEFRACCYQIYKSAQVRLEAILCQPGIRQARPAVIMDLDETVVDNSAFQTFLYQNQLEYSDELWAEYEKNYPQDVGLIPGAKQFIDAAEAQGVAVVFISNRTVAFQTSTESALDRLGIKTAKLPGRLLLKPQGGNSDKTARRGAAAAQFNIVMLFGDNLRDFSEKFVAPKLSSSALPDDYLKAIAQREAVMENERYHWGVDWFVLPNPVYGEWDKLIGTDPKALLQPTTMKRRPMNP